jgi:hypothetical protein
MTQSWKRFEVSWSMEHGGTWSMCPWHWNIGPKTYHVSVGGMFRALGYSGSETCVGSPAETWHVLMGGRFQSPGFRVHVSRWGASGN